MKAVLSLALSIGLVASASVYAHHSFAMFDMAQELRLTGTVKEFQWTNPHSWIQLTVPTANGGSEEWSIETMSPGALKHLGWHPDSIKAGDKVVARIHPLRNGKKGGDLIALQGPTGEVLYGLPPMDPNSRPKPPPQ